MVTIPWILIAIVVLIGILGIVSVVAYKSKGKKRKPNYYSLFMIGAIWVPFGYFMNLIYGNSSLGNIFFILGWIYFVIGLMHKDEWDKKRGPYMIEDKFWRWAVVVGLLVLLLFGIVAYFVVR
jgi:hypothetical protein|tara:strand:- start:6507 stop:6875 length:369 start_codon:yes stop_codon:yes gene_type:complete